MAKILIIYSTTDGHTQKICMRLKQVIESHNNLVELVPVEIANATDLGPFDKFIIGASVRYGKYNARIYEFIKINSQILGSKPSAFFSVNLVACNPKKDKPETNPYIQKLLTQISWKPKQLAVFAGKIDFQSYRFWDRLVMRLIMWINKGLTDPKSNIDYTNWNHVENFGQIINEM